MRDNNKNYLHDNNNYNNYNKGHNASRNVFLNSWDFIKSYRPNSFKSKNYNNFNQTNENLRYNRDLKAVQQKIMKEKLMGQTPKTNNSFYISKKHQSLENLFIFNNILNQNGNNGNIFNFENYSLNKNNNHINNYNNNDSKRNNIGDSFRKCPKSHINNGMPQSPEITIKKPVNINKDNHPINPFINQPNNININLNHNSRYFNKQNLFNNNNYYNSNNSNQKKEDDSNTNVFLKSIFNKEADNMEEKNDTLIIVNKVIEEKKREREQKNTNQNISNQKLTPNYNSNIINKCPVSEEKYTNNKLYNQSGQSNDVIKCEQYSNYTNITEKKVNIIINNKEFNNGPYNSNLCVNNQNKSNAFKIQDRIFGNSNKQINIPNSNINQINISTNTGVNQILN